MKSLSQQTQFVVGIAAAAAAKIKLRKPILVSERKRGSVPYGRTLAGQAHASGTHSRLCDTVG